MKWAVTFIASSLGIVALVLVSLWAVQGFGNLGMSTNGVIAMILGAALTAALAVGLMALVFYSARSEHDEAIRDRSEERRRDR